jgi:DNA-binding NtrC family response regulator
MPEGEALSKPAANATRTLALVADDTPEFGSSLAATIRAFEPSIRVVEVETGVEARNVLLKRRPQLAFLNLQLPKLTGAEALAWSVARGIRPFTVLMSGAALPRWIELSTKLRAYEFLRKPFDMAHVTHMLAARRRMTTPMRLLLADGSAPARQLIRRVLAESRFAFEIEESENGHDALNALRLASYEMAFIDRHLPGLDGLELACQAARIAPGTKFMLMAAGDARAVEQAAQFGIAALLKTPFYLWDVEIALHTAFGLRRPYLLSALPAHLEAEARRLRERLAEAKRIEQEGVLPPSEPEEAEAVFYL